MFLTVTFTGYSGSGKTTVVSKLVRELTDRGYKIAVIKHDGGEHGIKAVSDSDSELHSKAGAFVSIVSSGSGYVMQCMTAKDTPVEEFFTLIPPSADLVICEGYKNSDLPKIEVIRKESGKPRANEGDESLVAAVTDSTEIPDNVPKFDINDTKALADFVENKFIANKADIALNLIVDGKPIPTKDFLLKMLTYSVHGLIKPLKGCENPKEIIIKASVK